AGSTTIGMLTRPNLRSPLHTARVSKIITLLARYGRGSRDVDLVRGAHAPRVLIAAPSPQSSSQREFAIARTRDRQHARRVRSPKSKSRCYVELVTRDATQLKQPDQRFFD